MNVTKATHQLYFTAYPQGSVVTPRAHGLDVSKYDQFFTPETATGQIDFVVQRISYRTTRDEAFDTLLPGVMQVPVRLGYHYLNSDVSWKAQADAYLSYVSGYEYHAHVCDFEEAYNTLSSGFAYDSWKWIDYIQQRTGKECFIYTSKNLYNLYLYPSQGAYGIDWNTIPYWQAQWFLIPDPNGNPTMPTGRNTWDLWQYTSKGNGTLYGVARPTACDLDVYNGTIEELKTRLGVDGTLPPPPPTGETMEGIVLETGSIIDINIRTAPTSTAPDVGDLFAGDVITYDRKQNVTTGSYLGDWYHILKVLRVNGTTSTPVNIEWWCWGKNIKELVVTPPPPAPSTHTVDVIIDGALVYHADLD